MENKELKSIVTNDDITGNIKIVNLKEEDDKSNWNGQNLLGQVLDEVRETLIN